MDIVGIEITAALPSECIVEMAYKVEGAAKFLAVGAPPWVYLEVKKKEWYEPGPIEQWVATYERGFPMPVTGTFSIEWTPAKEGEYELRVVATPAPLALPVIGVPPITGQSDVMKVSVKKAAGGVLKNKELVLT